MSGVLELDDLLRSIAPEVQRGEYVFCTVQGCVADFALLEPLMCFAEAEGLTLILPVTKAREAGLAFDGIFKQMTLTVHSSLEAVGLTAAVAAKLTAHNISANVVAAFYHDHIFVPADKADAALLALQEFSS